MKVVPESLRGKVETLLPREALSAVLCSSLNVIQFRLKCCSYSHRFISFVRFFLREDCASLVAPLSQYITIHSGSWHLPRTFQLFGMEGCRVSHLESNMLRKFRCFQHQAPKIEIHSNINNASLWHRSKVKPKNRGLAVLMQMRVIMKVLHVRFESSRWWPNCKKKQQKNNNNNKIATQSCWKA